MQEVKFDKSKGTVSLMNSRFIEKHLFGYRKISELGPLSLLFVYPFNPLSSLSPSVFSLVLLLSLLPPPYLSSLFTMHASSLIFTSVVTELSEVVGVIVEKQLIMGGEGHVVRPITAIAL